MEVHTGSDWSAERFERKLEGYWGGTYITNGR